MFFCVKFCEFSSYYTRVIPERSSRVDGTGYGGGLSDAYHKTKLLQSDVEKFEKQCLTNLVKNSQGMNR